MNIEHYTYEQQRDFLRQKTQPDLGERSVELGIREHVSHCETCWQTWNQVRWDAAADSIGVQELEAYLGAQFLPYHDSSWKLAEEWRELQPQSNQEILDFYKQTQQYLYNLIIWHESGDRYDLRPDMEWLRDQFQIQSVIDFGSGVGTDTLLMLEQGLRVFPVDLISHSSNFLDWRLARRGFHERVLDAEALTKFPAADVFWAIDVLEHLPNPLETIERLHHQTRLFVHCSQFNEQDGGRHPFHINFDVQQLYNQLKIAGFSQVPHQSVLEVWWRP